MDIGRVIETDGKTMTSLWKDDYCDTLRGTDGTIFHPFLNEGEEIASYSPDICRSLSSKFEKKTSVAGWFLMPPSF